MPAPALCLFWLLYFTGLGVFFPYYALYLRENAGLSGTEVGAVLAVLPLVGMLAQPLWGQLADRTGARSGLLALLTAVAALGHLGLLLADDFPGYLLGTAALAACSTAVVPLALSVTFAALRGGSPHGFGLIRVWGTVGYLVGVACYPWALHRVVPADPGGGEPGLASMFWVTALCTLAAAALWPWLPRGGHVGLRAARGAWRELLHSGPLLRLLAFSFGGYLFLQGPTGLFPLLIRARGGTLTTVGEMWVVMLLLEIPLVALSGAGLRRLGARGLLGLGVFAGGVRWAVCGLSDDLAILYPVQLLHGVVVTGLLLGGPLYLEQIVPERLRSTGQGLLAMAGIGLGGILSNTIGGWLIDALGVDALFLIGGAGGLVLGACVTLVLPKPDAASRRR